jgi:hypothetical protein
VLRVGVLVLLAVGITPAVQAAARPLDRGPDAYHPFAFRQVEYRERHGHDDRRPQVRGELGLALTAPSLTLDDGATGRVDADVSAERGFSGPVRVTVGGLPQRVRAEVAPAAFGLVGTGDRRRVTITVVRAGDARPGSYQVGVTASSGRLARTIWLTLVLTPPRPALVLTAEPAELTLSGGQQGVVRLRLDRSAPSRRPRHDPRHGHQDPLGQLRPDPGTATVTGLPTGATARFERSGAGLLMTLTAGANPPSGDYPLTVTVGRPGERASTVVLLHLPASVLGFRISGDVPQELNPGMTVPINLTVTNPNTEQLRVTALTAAVDHLDDAHRDACPVADNFTVTGFTGDYTALVVAGGGSVSLAGLRLPEAGWPQLKMLDTDVDQTGCLGAVLTLRYTGTALVGTT